MLKKYTGWRMMSTSLDTWLIVIFYILDIKNSYSKQIISFPRCYCVSFLFFTSGVLPVQKDRQDMPAVVGRGGWLLAILDSEEIYLHLHWLQVNWPQWTMAADSTLEADMQFHQRNQCIKEKVTFWQLSTVVTAMHQSVKVFADYKNPSCVFL